MPRQEDDQAGQEGAAFVPALDPAQRSLPSRPHPSPPEQIEDIMSSSPTWSINFSEAEDHPTAEEDSKE